MDPKQVENQLQYLFEPPLLEEIIREGTLKIFQPEDELIDIDQEITRFPIVLSGSLKIMREDNEGNELLLYYLESGDTCAMTLQCCLSHSKSPIRVIAEEVTEAILIPIAKLEDWIVKYPSWRKYVFDSYASRLDEMLEAIDNLAFLNLEERLYKYLRDKALITGSADLRLTHHQIAGELNTSRVVVSRIMKKLEQQGKISQNRNQVTVAL